MISRIIHRALICMLAVMISLPTFSHPSWGIHVDEMYSVLPFATEKDGTVTAANIPVREWLILISKDLIDDYNNVRIPEYAGRTFYQYLKDEFDFSLGFGNHRLLFHWGYNSKPWNRELDRYVINHQWDIGKIERFKRTLVSEQKRRNKLANNETEKVFGFASAGQQAEWANALLAIVYDVHLLGDYTKDDNSNFAGVTVPSEVAKDLIDAVRKIDRSDMSYRIVDKIRRVVADYPDPHELANQLICVLQREMPGFLLKARDGQLKKRFEAMGFDLKSSVTQSVNSFVYRVFGNSK